MNITVIGTGYVGLVSGACFAEMGNTVTCVDTDEQKIALLKKGTPPIYEPGLESLVQSNVKESRLRFISSLPEAMKDSFIYFIAVGTPPGEDGSADLKHVLAVAREIGENINRYSIIVNKSTVPVGTADKVKKAVLEEMEKRGVAVQFDVVSNPEFLKEGAAVEDFMRPDRVIIGCDSEEARNVLQELYAPFTRNHERTVFMDIKSAEMTKYAANAMLATRISFMNEIATLCDLLKVDVENVRKGIGSDPRIGYSFIYPGCGYGGSCLPKDVKALIRLSEENEFDPKILRAVEERNETQKHRLFEKITQRFGDDLSRYVFGVWGLSFKPGTDDLREATSVVLLHELIGAGAKVKAYDPVAMVAARRELPHSWFEMGHLALAEHPYGAIENVDAMILVTEWKPFRHPDFDQMKKKMKTSVVFDGRNQYDPQLLRGMGFEYYGIGRS